MTPQSEIDPRLRRARIPAGLIPGMEDTMEGPVIPLEPARSSEGYALQDTSPEDVVARHAAMVQPTATPTSAQGPGLQVGTPAPARTVHDEQHHGVKAILGDILKSALAGVGTVDPRAGWQEKLGGLMGGAATGAVRPQTAHDVQYEQEYNQWAPKQQMAEEQAANEVRRAHTLGEMSGVNPYTNKPTEGARARMVHEGDVANQQEALAQHRKEQEVEANARTAETQRARTVQEQELYTKNQWTVPPDVAKRWGQPELANKVLPKPKPEEKAGDWETITDRATGKMVSRNKLTGAMRPIAGITGERQRDPNTPSPGGEAVQGRFDRAERTRTSKEFEKAKRALTLATAEHGRLSTLPTDNTGQRMDRGKYISEADVEKARQTAEAAEASFKGASEAARESGWTLRDKDSAIDYKASPKGGASPQSASAPAPQKVVTYKGQRHRVVKTNADGSYELDPNPIQ